MKGDKCEECANEECQVRGRPEHIFCRFKPKGVTLMKEVKI